jgi:preprotein translocase SecF subunit
MFSLIQKRRWYFLISACLIVPGLIAMIISTAQYGAPLRLGIDFTGGTLLELRFAQPVQLDQVREIVKQGTFVDASVQEVGSDGNTILIRVPIEVTAADAVAAKEALKKELATSFGEVTELQSQSVGPSVGQETARAAVFAVIASSIAILCFVALAWRKVPNSARYGVCAIAKMLHDVIFLLGVGSILGLVAGWELDSLFLTALLTVIGFSVQDVIVVFDRIRENVPKRKGEPFETVVNRSLLETMHRSLATQLNAIFVMVAIIFFGGVTIRNFMITMLVGMVTGTYSSLFFAVPLLVVWEKGEIGRLLGRHKSKPAAA